MAEPSVAGEARHRRPGSSRRPGRSARRCRGPARRRSPARRPRGWRPGGRRRPDSARRPTSSSPLPSTNDPRKSMAKARAALPVPRAACVAAMVEPLLSRRLVRRTVANARRGNRSTGCRSQLQTGGYRIRCRIRRVRASRDRRHAGLVGPRVPSAPPTPPGGRGR